MVHSGPLCPHSGIAITMPRSIRATRSVDWVWDWTGWQWFVICHIAFAHLTLVFHLLHQPPNCVERSSFLSSSFFFWFSRKWIVQVCDTHKLTTSRQDGWRKHPCIPFAFQFECRHFASKHDSSSSSSSSSFWNTFWCLHNNLTIIEFCCNVKHDIALATHPSCWSNSVKCSLMNSWMFTFSKRRGNLVKFCSLFLQNGKHFGNKHRLCALLFSNYFHLNLPLLTSFDQLKEIDFGSISQESSRAGGVSGRVPRVLLHPFNPAWQREYGANVFIIMGSSSSSSIQFGVCSRQTHKVCWLTWLVHMPTTAATKGHTQSILAKYIQNPGFPRSVSNVMMAIVIRVDTAVIIVLVPIDTTFHWFVRSFTWSFVRLLFLCGPIQYSICGQCNGQSSSFFPFISGPMMGQWTAGKLNEYVLVGVRHCTALHRCSTAMESYN